MEAPILSSVSVAPEVVAVIAPFVAYANPLREVANRVEPSMFTSLKTEATVVDVAWMEDTLIVDVEIRALRAENTASWPGVPVALTTSPRFPVVEGQAVWHESPVRQSSSVLILTHAFEDVPSSYLLSASGWMFRMKVILFVGAPRFASRTVSYPKKPSTAPPIRTNAGRMLFNIHDDHCLPSLWC